MRRPDPRIAAQIRAALGGVGPVIDVGAGPGSYEPPDLPVIAVEPAVTMLKQRPGSAGAAVRGAAESLPFPPGSFGAGMAILTIHHWSDLSAGLAELRRVVNGPVVVLTWDTKLFDEYWMVAEYVPASRALDRHVPSAEKIAELLGGGRIEVVPVPADCVDGFYAAWWRRPHAYLDPTVRMAISGLARLNPTQVEPGIERLERDLDSGEWHRRHGHLLSLDSYDAGYRLVIAEPAPT